MFLNRARARSLMLRETGNGESFLSGILFVQSAVNPRRSEIEDDHERDNEHD
jgi:hypothetical protein